MKVKDIKDKLNEQLVNGEMAYTVSEVAHVTGMHYQFVYRMKRGECENPTMRTIERYEVAFDVLDKANGWGKYGS